MRVEAVNERYDLVAPLYGIPPAELAARDVAAGPERRRWVAIDGDRVVGAVHTSLRPDHRLILSFRAHVPRVYRSLIEAVVAGEQRRLYAIVDESDVPLRDAADDAGFGVEVVGERFRIRFDAAKRFLEGRTLPSGYTVRTANAVDEDRLFTLDSTLRQDVPGTDGWRGNRSWFAEELTESPPFEPGGYRVAIDDHNGEYVALARMWRNPGGPRFGLIGVLPQYRGTRVAAGLLAEVIAASSHWGHETFVTETSPANRAVYPRMRALGAESLGRFFQLVRA